MYGFESLDKQVKYPSEKYDIAGISSQFESHLHQNREGWIGWMGMGGSIL